MKPRSSVVPLGVADLERSLAFYRDGLGVAAEGIIGQEFEYGAVVFFKLQHGLLLALWPTTSIARDTGLPLQLASAPASATAFSIGHNVSSREEVDVLLEEARRAGAKIVKPAAATFYGGYAAYFLDPDDHLWEIVRIPNLSPPD